MFQPVDSDAGLAQALDAYRRRWPAESGQVELFAGLGREGRQGPDPYARARLEGHFTASSWLLDRTRSRVLLTHHRKLDRWLQLGGHADGERDLRAVALREAEEESGLGGLVAEGDIFDLDRHWIPEHKGVPGHWHYDVRYVVHATASDEFRVSDESHALAWRHIEVIAGDATLDPSLRRMARKWLGL